MEPAISAYAQHRYHSMDGAWTIRSVNDTQPWMVPRLHTRNNRLWRCVFQRISAIRRRRAALKVRWRTTPMIGDPGKALGLQRDSISRHA